jgi:hypothetical protein
VVVEALIAELPTEAIDVRSLLIGSLMTCLHFRIKIRGQVRSEFPASIFGSKSGVRSSIGGLAFELVQSYGVGQVPMANSATPFAQTALGATPE